MSYIDSGFNEFLERTPAKSVKPYTPQEIQVLFPELNGEKISNYTSQQFNFIPTNPSANPKEGDIYYDKNDKKLKIFTGAEYEEVSSI